MVPYKYSYFIGCTVFFLIWLFLFKKNPKYRLEMLLLGSIGVVMGPLLNYFLYLQDWWNPLYITGTKGGIEDVLLGFTNLGIVAVLYEELFDKKYTRIVALRNLKFGIGIYRFLLVALVSLVPMLSMFFIFKIHSFWCNVVGLLLGGLFILKNRPDLLKDSLWSAFLMFFISLPGFVIPELLSRGWVRTFWQMDKLSGITILYAPLEDLIWYALIGFCFGSIFEYLFDFKIRK